MKFQVQTDRNPVYRTRCGVLGWTRAHVRTDKNPVSSGSVVETSGGGLGPVSMLTRSPQDPLWRILGDVDLRPH